MKKVLDENIKKIAIGLLIILIVAIIVLIVINKNDKIKIKEFKNNIYTIKYDNSWSINKSNEKDLLLKHSNNGIITINVEELEEPYKYETLNTLIDDIVFGIEKQNKDYLLLGQEKLKLTKKELDGYKLLYEKGDKQVLVIIIKQSDKLITYIYEADYEYFDILLDSAQSILYNFELNNEKIDLTTDVFKIENQNIVWKGKDKVNKTQKYRLNDEHYTVDYEIPSEYSMYEFDEKLGIYYYDNDIDKSLTTNIRNLNMYEEISKNVLYDIENIKKNNSNVKVETTKGKLKDSYIYRVTYDYKNDYTEKNVKNEIVYYLIPLDNYHTFIFKLEHEDNYISEAIINSLKIKKLSKYSKNIDRNYEGNYIVNYMKIFKDRDRTNYYDIKLLTPPKWQELDNTNNRYQYRYFGLNYIEKKAEYEINASYKFAYNNTFDFATTLYKNKNLKVISTEHKNYNNKEFDIERFTYMEQKSTNYGVAIVYKISDDYWLDITIVSPKNNINDTMLKELTNFTIEEKEYK